MAFEINNFDNVSSGAGNSPRLWAYRNTSDTLAEIAASGYFTSARFRLDEDDLIFVVGSDGADQLLVTSALGVSPSTSSVYIPPSGGAPSSATYIVQTPDAFLPNEQALSVLATGIVKNTTTTGVLSIATSNVDYQAADAALISISGLTTAADKMIYTTALDVYAVTDLTSAGRALLDDANAAAQLVTLGAQASLSGASLTAVTAATNDKVLIQDTSDSNNLKTVTVQTILDLASGGGLEWSEVAGTSANAAVNDALIIGNAAQTTITLPATAAIGDMIRVQGKGAGGWILTANTGQTIKMGAATTSSAGSLTSANLYDAIQIVCITANTTWASMGAVSAGLTVT